MPAIHQLLAGFTNGDAISNEAKVMRSLFRSWGFESDIFCETRRILPELRATTKDLKTCAESVGPDDITILHLSTGSAVNHVFPTLNCRRVIRYHNVTPAHFLESLHRQMAQILVRGRKEVEMLAGSAELSIAVSDFNGTELTSAGYDNVVTLPIVFNLDHLSDKVDQATIKSFSDGLTNILFVGRCAPNKKLEDLLLAFSVYQKTVNPKSRFIHAGSYAGLERYYRILKTMVRDLGLKNVHFMNSVPQARLNALYQVADLFLCMSEHEGFCIPLVESMVNELPILAYAAAAIPETLSGSGMLVTEKNYGAIAEMMGRMTSDQQLRTSIIKGQNERLEAYNNRNPAEELRTCLAPILGDA